MITDERILEEAIRLVDDGVSVTLPVNGQSMLPFIIGGKESVILTKPLHVQVGDIVLAWVEGCRYVVHRIICIDGEHVTLMGDGNIVGVEHCTTDDVKALVKKGFVLREVCGEHVIVGEGLGAVNFGKLLALNETAAWLWKQAVEQEDFTAESLTEKLCEEYDVEPAAARKDVEGIIAKWQEVGVVE